MQWMFFWNYFEEIKGIESGRVLNICWNLIPWVIRLQFHNSHEYFLLFTVENCRKNGEIFLFAVPLNKFESPKELFRNIMKHLCLHHMPHENVNVNHRWNVIIFFVNRKKICVKYPQNIVFIWVSISCFRMQYFMIRQDDAWSKASRH